MDNWETGRLVYLVLLGTALAGYYFVSHRDRIGQMARHALLWGLIFIGVVAGAGLWLDMRHDVPPRQSALIENTRIEVPRNLDGHYYLTLAANDALVNFVVDTGATEIVLSRQDAVRAGIDPDRLVYSSIASTANGTVRTARTKLNMLRIGPIIDHDVAVWVNEGEMETSLLGMAYLRRFQRLEIADGLLVLER